MVARAYMTISAARLDQLLEAALGDPSQERAPGACGSSSFMGRLAQEMDLTPFYRRQPNGVQL